MRPSEKTLATPLTILSVRMWWLKIQMIENCREREFYFTNLAADHCLPQMVAELLSHPKRQFHPPELPKIIGIHFCFTTKIPGDTLLTKIPAELPSAEQIFTETSRLVPL